MPADPVTSDQSTSPVASNSLLLVLSWLWVGVPLAWGVWETLHDSAALWK